MAVQCECGKKNVRTKFCSDCGKKVDGDSPTLKWISECENNVQFWQNKFEEIGNETADKEIDRINTKLKMWRKRVEILANMHKAEIAN